LERELEEENVEFSRETLFCGLCKVSNILIFIRSVGQRSKNIDLVLGAKEYRHLRKKASRSWPPLATAYGRSGVGVGFDD
jgi:hypothetical protein